jgi:hypothetical protein
LAGLSDAKATAEKLGMGSSASASLCIDLGSELDLNDDFYVGDGENDHGERENSIENGEDGEDDIPLDILAAFPSEMSSNFDLCSDDTAEERDDSPLPPTSMYVRFVSSKGRFVTMRKTTLCWLLRTEGVNVSNDRMLRVRAEVLKPFKKKSQDPIVNNTMRFCDEVSLGDFCIFEIRNNQYLLGQILAFSYLSGKNKAFSLDSAPTTAPVRGAKGLGCLCSWFKMTRDGYLSRVQDKHDFVDAKKYRFTVPPPTVNETGILLENSDANKLLKFRSRFW